MTERFRFSVVYDPATVKSAAREYMWRHMTIEYTWPSILLAFALVDAAGLALFAREFNFTTGLFAGYGLILLLILALMRYGLLNKWRAATSEAGANSVEFVLADEGIEWTFPLVSAKVSYKYFQRVVKLKQAWVLMRGSRPTVVLITAQVPADALKFLGDKLARPLGAA